MLIIQHNYTTRVLRLQGDIEINGDMKYHKNELIITKNLLTNDYNDLKTYYEGGNRDDSN